MTDKPFICKMVEVQELTQCTMCFGPAPIQSLAWNTLSTLSHHCSKLYLTPYLLLPTNVNFRQLKKVQNTDYFYLLNMDIRTQG